MTNSLNYSYYTYGMLEKRKIEIESWTERKIYRDREIYIYILIERESDRDIYR